MGIPRGHAAVRCCLLRRPFVPGVSLGGTFSGMSVAYHYRIYSWSPLLVARLCVSLLVSGASGAGIRHHVRITRGFLAVLSPKPLDCGISPGTVQTKAAQKNRLLAGSCLRASWCSSHPPESRLRRRRSSPPPPPELSHSLGLVACGHDL